MSMKADLYDVHQVQLGIDFYQSCHAGKYNPFPEWLRVPFERDMIPSRDYLIAILTPGS